MAFYSQALPSYTIGDNAYDDIPRVCEPYGSTAVVIGGKRAMQAARQYLIDALKDSKIKILDFVWYGGEASFENGDALIENPVVKQADMVFSMGGGKCVDCVKYVCYKLNMCAGIFCSGNVLSKRSYEGNIPVFTHSSKTRFY